MRVSVLLFLLACACKAPGKSTEEAPEIQVVAPPPITPRADGAHVEYTVRFPNAANHYLEVEAIFPSQGNQTTLMLPVWTPGSYFIREYSRFVEKLRAQDLDGQALDLRKLTKNRWQVDTTGIDKLAITYQVYGRDMSVRTNFIDTDIGVVSPPATFIAPVDAETDAPLQVRYDISFEAPEHWPEVVTGLPTNGADKRSFVAADYDALMDAPIVLGSPAIYDFSIENVPHRLANFGEGSVWDGKRTAEDTEAITKELIEFWGIIPYANYTYINVIGQQGGGLEHRNSTLIMTHRWRTRNREEYMGWLGLVCHEFFHTWNVKRLRPKGLGPFDYEREVYTPSLWIAEGITSYYDDLLVRRAGLITRDEYLKALSEQIESVQTTPGRLEQSLSDSSFDTWTKFYRRTENSDNVHISYYRKGAVIAFLLDTEIRRATKGRKSLDTVMRLAYQRHATGDGYTPADFRGLVAEVAGAPMENFFADYVDGTAELNFEPALAYFGLEFAPSKDEKQDKDSDKEDEKTPWIGAKVSGARVTYVEVESPAFLAGVNVGDEVLAINDYRVTSGHFTKHLGRHKPADKVTLLVSRRGQLRKIEMTLGERAPPSWKLKTKSGVNRAVTSRRRDWLD